MSWLSPYRWLIIGGLIAALIAGYFAWANHQQDIGYERARSEYTATALIEQQKSAKITADWQKQKDEAINDATSRAIKAKADADRLHAVNGGLRDDLASARSQLSSASTDSLRRYAATANAVFGECAREVESMAGQLESIASDALTLHQAWPK